MSPEQLIETMAMTKFEAIYGKLTFKKNLISFFEVPVPYLEDVYPSRSDFLI